MEPVTDLDRSSEPHRGRHNDRLMWVTMLGCCVAVPVALIIAGVSGASLAGAKPWLLATVGALAIALAIAHRRSAMPGCDAGAATADPDVGRRTASPTEASHGDAA